MSATVTLTVANGPLSGKCFVFRETAFCTIGRAADCEVQVPNIPEYLNISRHHCLLNIEPPHVRVSDFRSLNGTFLNGVNIGMRDRDRPMNSQPAFDTPPYELKNGDEIRVGHLVFRVTVNPEDPGTEAGKVPEMAFSAG